MCRARSTSWLRTRTPPEAMAPMASSSWPGKPSLRTRKTSRGAFSAWATSKATGTPPRGNARTCTSGRLAYVMSLSARTRPASVRSRKSMAVILYSLRWVLCLLYRVTPGKPTQVAREPVGGQAGDFLQGPRLLEEVGGAGDDHQLFFLRAEL